MAPTPLPVRAPRARIAGMARSHISSCRMEPMASRPERPISENRCAVHDAPLRAIVVAGGVLGHAVVPERQVVPAPLPAHRELRPGDPLAQHLQQRRAFAWFQLIDARGERLTGEQPLRLVSGCMRITDKATPVTAKRAGSRTSITRSTGTWACPLQAVEFAVFPGDHDHATR